MNQAAVLLLPTCPSSPMTRSLMGLSAALSWLRSRAWPSTVMLEGSSMSVSSSGVWMPPLVRRSCSRLGLRTSKEAVVENAVREKGTVNWTCEEGAGKGA